MKDSEEESIETFQEGCEGEKLDKIFKKPILIGKIGKLPKRLPPKIHDSSEDNAENQISGIQEPQSNEIATEPQASTSNIINEKSQQLLSKHAEEPIRNTAPAHPLKGLEKTIPLPYKEPVWSGLPVSNGKNYSLDVLKNGSIIERINLMDKPFWVFGRLSNCNICMEHPTISRYHAVLQYKKEPSEADGPGFYIYDLDSTHGTFLNKNRLKPKVFVRIQVGHMLKLGCSTRSYILLGPEFDEEEESELTVTELKQKRAEELIKREEEALRKQKEMEEQKKREEERGVDWGLGEDADEETDLSENPYAQTNNEELYLDDPKKALRGFFEREGLDLEYRCDEQGIGQFICKVDLPVDDEMGRTIVAEVLHKGKKKEAVVQCALEACRILDRHGVLRQAMHESRKRKAKNWEDNDFYDSDEDTFLDRTGTIEKKREKRMNAKAPQKVETYESLVEKEKCIATSIKDIERQISTVQNKMESDNNRANDEDSLDSYMKNLTDANLDKKSIAKLKVDLSNLKTEQAKIVRLINLVKPANLPPLAVKEESAASTSKESTTKSLPIFGKRRKIQFKFEQKSKYDVTNNDMDDEEDDDMEDKTDKVEEKTTEHQDPVTNVTENQPEIIENTSEIERSSSSNVEQDETAASTTSACLLKILEGTMAFKEFDSILKKGFPSYTGKYRDKLAKIIDNIKNLASNEDRMRVDLKMLSAKNDKVTKLLADMKRFQPPDEKMEHRAWSELDRILVELSAMAEEKFKVLGEVKKMGNEIKDIFEDQKNQSVSNKSVDESTSSVNERLVGEENVDNVDLKDGRRKRKNQKRIQHRQGKQEQDRQKEYEADASREDYNMWVPPGDQSGDGRTSLNDKLGY